MSDYTPRKEEGEAFALPPVPEGEYEHTSTRGVKFRTHSGIQVLDYGHACAEAARAPLAEENTRLLARIAELEQYEEMVILRCGKLETFDEYRAAMQRDDSDRLRADVEAMKGLCIPTREDAERQQWKGMGGAIAYHLIDRHADSWDEAARMMHAWRDANPPAEVEALRALLDGAAKTRAPKPRTLPTVGTGALHGEQQYCFEKGCREGASAVRKAIAAKVAAIAARKGEGVEGA